MACAAAAPQQRRPYGPQGRPQGPNQGPPALPSYTGNAPVYRDEMNFKREEVPVYREAEKNPEKRQAAYAPAPALAPRIRPPDTSPPISASTEHNIRASHGMTQWWKTTLTSRSNITPRANNTQDVSKTFIKGGIFPKKSNIVNNKPYCWFTNY